MYTYFCKGQLSLNLPEFNTPEFNFCIAVDVNTKSSRNYEQDCSWHFADFRMELPKDVITVEVDLVSQCAWLDVIGEYFIFVTIAPANHWIKIEQISRYDVPVWSINYVCCICLIESLLVIHVYHSFCLHQVHGVTETMREHSKALNDTIKKINRCPADVSTFFIFYCTCRLF